MASLSSWTLHNNHNLCDLFSIKKNPNSLNNQHLSVFYSITYNPDQDEQKLDMQNCIILSVYWYLYYINFWQLVHENYPDVRLASSVFKKHTCVHSQRIFTITLFSLAPTKYISYLDQNFLMFKYWNIFISFRKMLL